MFSQKGPFAKIVGQNQFWICAEAVSDDVAASLKKFMRSEKKNMDENNQNNNQKMDYKISRRRIRIVIVKEDLFTLLVDAMT